MRTPRISPKTSPKTGNAKRAQSRDFDNVLYAYKVFNTSNAFVIYSNVQVKPPESLSSEHRSKSATKIRSIFKKESLFDRKQREINIENQRLLEKMTKIHTEKQEIASNTLYIAENSLSIELIERPPVKIDKSLNRPQRKRRLIDIMDKNKQLLKHLKAQKSEYSIENCNKWRGYHEKILQTICKYPYQPMQTASSPVDKYSPRYSDKNIADFEKYIQEQEKQQKKMAKKLQEKNTTFRGLRTLTPTVRTPNCPIIEDYIADSVSLKNQGRYLLMSERLNILYV